MESIEHKEDRVQKLSLESLEKSRRGKLGCFPADDLYSIEEASPAGFEFRKPQLA